MREQSFGLLELGNGCLDLPTLQAEPTLHFVNHELGGAAWERVNPSAELLQQKICTSFLAERLLCERFECVAAEISDGAPVFLAGGTSMLVRLLWIAYQEVDGGGLEVTLSPTGSGLGPCIDGRLSKSNGFGRSTLGEA